MPNTMLSHFCPPAVITALDAGDEVMSFHRDATPSTGTPDMQSAFSAARKAANDLIMKRLQALWDLPVITAENPPVSNGAMTDCEEYWLVDPLNGEADFAERNGAFTVSIALIDHGEPVFGVVAAPALETLFFGASRCGARKAVRGVDFDTREELVAKLTDTDHNFTRLPLFPPQERPFTAVLPAGDCNVEAADFIERLENDHGTAVRMAAGGALMQCILAEGTADVYPQFGTTFPWQTAAAHAILIAAGGDVLESTTGESLTYAAIRTVNPFFAAYSRDFV